MGRKLRTEEIADRIEALDKETGQIKAALTDFDEGLAVKLVEAKTAAEREEVAVACAEERRKLEARLRGNGLLREQLQRDLVDAERGARERRLAELEKEGRVVTEDAKVTLSKMRDVLRAYLRLREERRAFEQRADTLNGEARKLYRELGKDAGLVTGPAVARANYALTEASGRFIEFMNALEGACPDVVN